MLDQNGNIFLLRIVIYYIVNEQCIHLLYSKRPEQSSILFSDDQNVNFSMEYQQKGNLLHVIRPEWLSI